jgi:hypothetical protein
MAKGRVRLLLGELRAEADRVTAAAAELPPAMVAAALGRSIIGSRQALRHVAKRIPIPPMMLGVRMGIWRFLQPGPVPGRPDQSAVVVRALLLGADKRPALTIEPFGLCFLEHALGRLFDQSSGPLDATRVMLEAHGALLALTPSEGDRVYELGRIMVPAAGGAFLVRPQVPTGDDPPMATAVSWISRDQAWDDQDAILDRWDAVLAPPAT